MQTFSFPIRISLLYAALFVSYGIHLPFMPVWLAERGINETGIAIILAAPMFVRVATTLVSGSLIDLWGDRRMALIVLAGLTGASMGLYLVAEGFAQILAVSLLAALTWGTLLITLDAVAVTGARAGLGDFGRMRLWGSASFIMASTVGGWIVAATGSWVVVPIIAGSFLALSVLALATPVVAIGGEDGGDAPRLGIIASLRTVWAVPGLVVVLAAASIGQASHAVLYSFGSLFWKGNGYSAGSIGLLWSIGVLSEIGLLFLSGRIMGRIGAVRLIAIGAIGGAVRFALFPLDLGPVVTVTLQTLHAASFAAVFIGMMQVVSSRVPPHLAATAQGLVMTTNGLALAVMTLAAGPLYHRFGGQAFWAMALVCVVAASIALVQLRRERETSG
ncbi:MAG: MFS transporter [Hyphomicrobiaceae bacterium]|nr:MFS transporter [Hyphomicrobiaceae bacterium]